jgi:pimeloyl-ACP methyl ester carboxylesterase
MEPNMPQHISEGPARFQSHVEADSDVSDLFDGLHADFDPERNSVAGLRRRRRRASNSPENPIKTVSLVEQDGVLYWRDGIPARSPTLHRRRRRGAEPSAEGSLVLAKEFPVLAPNKVIAAIGAIDQRLNPEIAASLRSRLRPLRQGSDETFVLDKTDVTGPFSGRTLLFVHGTFSNAKNMLEEFIASKRGLRFLNRATHGAKKYDQVVFFEHPTLSVSPVINALELGRAFAGSTGQIDVIAHSRGGLVVRWWLEAFGNSLRVTAATPVRAILAGSPLRGTSLAAPDKIQNAMSLVSNIGTFAEKTLNLVGVANPFLWVAGKLVEVIVSVTGALAKTPLVDALVALVPGLSGQSAVDNNHELDRLRLGPCVVDPSYYAIKSNFETQNPGWRFWRNFRKDRAGDLAADIVFPGDNDLVVDTWSMTELGVPKLKLAGPSRDFGNSGTVWHCNYFRQDKTINYIAENLGIALD